MSRDINQNVDPLFIFEMPDDEVLANTISVKGEKGEKGDPTKLSELENDTGFITASTSSLTNYYTKTQSDTALNAKLDKTTFNSYEIPSDFFTSAETASGSGSSILVEDTSEALLKSIVIKGNTTQSATPTPASPVNVGVATGAQTITITGGGTQTYPISLGNIELCKVGNYQDYIYRSNGSWILHKETSSVTLDGSEDWHIYNNVLQLYAITDYAISGNAPISDHFVGVSNVSGLSAVPDKSICFNQTSGATTPRFYLKDTSLFMSVSDLQTWLGENPTKVYYALATATETAISDATLIAQLNALARANSYNGDTNIMVSGNTPAILSVEAFKNGWSGTVSGIDSDIDELRSRQATKTTLGLVKVGDGLSVDGGEVSVEPTPKMLFHSVAASSATYIVEFPNGKNMLIDTGLASQWSDIKTAIDGLGITKFDYAVVTHVHTDHIGNIQNFIDNYDMSSCTWYVQMKPDFVNHASDLLEPESYYTNFIAIFTSNGITPIVPANNSTVTVDEKNDISLRFLNTDATIAENYYGRYAEFYEGRPINYNDFSLITEITHKNVKILSTGDLERPVEEQYVDFIGKINVMTMPHHGVNQDACRAFYYAAMPDYAIFSMPATSIQGSSWYKSQYYAREVGAKLVGNGGSIAIDGLYTFISDGDNVTTTVLNSQISDTLQNNSSPYEDLEGLIRFTIDNPATMTLTQLISNLPRTYDCTFVWTADLQTKYGLTQIKADLEAIFPVTVSDGMHINIKARRLFYELNIYDEKVSFHAKTRVDDLENWKMRGQGELGGIASKSALLSLLPRLPFGHYTCNSYQETDSAVLASNFTYILDINITNKSSTATVGIINATAKDLAAHSASYITNAVSYYQSNASPYIYWRGISITNTL